MLGLLGNIVCFFILAGSMYVLMYYSNSEDGILINWTVWSVFIIIILYNILPQTIDNIFIKKN